MKFLVMLLVSLTVFSCASKDDKREPSSEDVSQGVNSDYYYGSGGSR